jgi:two-component system chemotaxis response regulator CheB
MCSTLTQNGADTTMQALAAGAVEAIGKPKVDPRSGLQEASARLLEAVKAAARARVGRQLGDASPVVPSTPAPAFHQQTGAGRVLALGASTGGTNALEAVLAALPATTPGLVIVQHMPAGFTTAFAARLNRVSALEVREAADGDSVQPGRALIAPGDRHMRLRRRSTRYVVTVSDGPLVSRHRPSVDVLFQSVAKEAGHHAMGVIMTGMGDDGVNGLDTMRRAGAPTLAQDEASCVVYGMPREAVERGAAVDTVALSDIPERLLAFAAAGGPQSRA